MTKRVVKVPSDEAGKDRNITFFASWISGCFMLLLKAMAFNKSAGINIGATQGKVTASSIIPSPCTVHTISAPSTSSRRR